MSSSSRGSWSSTHRKCGTCFTWNFLWTQILMSDCLAEVQTFTSLTVARKCRYRHSTCLIFTFARSSPRHEPWQRPGADSNTVHNVCQTGFWRVLPACKCQNLPDESFWGLTIRLFLSKWDKCSLGCRTDWQFNSSSIPEYVVVSLGKNRNLQCPLLIWVFVWWWLAATLPSVCLRAAIATHVVYYHQCEWIKGSVISSVGALKSHNINPIHYYN